MSQRSALEGTPKISKLDTGCNATGSKKHSKFLTDGKLRDFSRDLAADSRFCNCAHAKKRGYCRITRLPPGPLLER
eukprot:851258-Pleurochrysis_carterae.AAC.1